MTGEDLPLPGETWKVRRRSLNTQRIRNQCKESRVRKAQANLTPRKETNKARITDLKEMEIHELSDKEFRIMPLVCELRDHTTKQN